MAAAFAAKPADAGLEIQLQSDSTQLMFAGLTPLVVNQSIGNFFVNVNIGNSTSAPLLDLASTNDTSSTGGTLAITLSATDFTSPVGIATWLTRLTTNNSGATTQVQLSTYLDNTNTTLTIANTSSVLAAATLIGTISTSDQFIALSDSFTASTASPFAIIEVMTITAGGQSSLSLDASVRDSVPEPASLTLLGSALVGLGMASRRKRKAA
jgi:hypothetical protein